MKYSTIQTNHAERMLSAGKKHSRNIEIFAQPFRTKIFITGSINMRPWTAKIKSWDDPLYLFEKKHLKDEGIKSKADLIASLDWQRMFTKECEECKLILTKLGSN